MALDGTLWLSGGYDPGNVAFRPNGRGFNRLGGLHEAGHSLAIAFHGTSDVAS